MPSQSHKPTKNAKIGSNNEEGKESVYEEIKFLLWTLNSVNKAYIYLGLSIALSFSITLLEAAGVISVVPILQFIGSDPLQGKGIVLEPLFRLIQNDSGSVDIRKVATFVLIVALLKPVFTFFSGIVTSSIPIKMRVFMIKYLVHLHLRTSLLELGKHDAGSWTSVYYRFIDQYCSLIMTIASSVTQILLFLLYAGIMFTVSPHAVLLTILFVMVLWLLTRRMSTLQGRIGRLITDAAAAYQQAGLQMISGIRLVRAVAGEDRMADRIRKKLNAFVQLHYKAIAVSCAMQPITASASGFLVAALLFFGNSLFTGSEADWLGSIILFVLVFYRMLSPATALYSVRITVAQLWPALRMAKKYVDICKNAQMHFGDQDLGSHTSCDIQVRNLCFSFKKTLTLKNITLDVPFGSMLALVGASGAGKSTFAHMLMRFYPSEPGQILIDGIDLQDFSRESFAEHVALVSQDTILFNDTLRNNFLFVQPDATEEQIWAALDKVKASEFVQDLENGLDTIIQEGGNRLSGGQRQRIALARALIKPKRILILDESTSQLDAFSEAVVQKTISSLHGQTTLIVIAHRMSTVRNADAVAVMEKGRIIEFGPPASLSQADTLFRQMLEHQSVDPDR